MLTVIIPAYNAENVLENCLQSLHCEREWAYPIEILVVNDGSRDQTKDIANCFFSRYPVGRVVDKSNGGRSSARNEGLRIAQGKYIYFMDADDGVERAALERLIEVMESNDSAILFTSYFEINISTHEQRQLCCQLPRGKIVGREFEEVFHRILSRERNQGIAPLWNKIYRNDIIRKYNIKFDEVMDYGEDLAFNIDYLRNVNNCYIADFPLYYYKIEGEYKPEKYSQVLIRSIIKMQNRLLDINASYNIYNPDTVGYQKMQREFYTTMINCLSRQQYSKKIVKGLKKDKAVRELGSFGRKLSRKHILLLQMSRRDKWVIMLLKVGWWRLAMKLKRM